MIIVVIHSANILYSEHYILTYKEFNLQDLVMITLKLIHISFFDLKNKLSPIMKL